MKNILKTALMLFIIPSICFAQDAITQATPKHEEQPLRLAIETDKDVYKVGEEIAAILTYKGEIYQWGNDAWSIQRWENGLWKTIQRKGDPYFLCANIPECKNINLDEIQECDFVLCERPIWYKVQEMPKSVLRFEWDQSYKADEETFQCSFIQRTPHGQITSEEIVDRTCAVFKQVTIGKYKIRFEYAISVNPDDPFSREVDIKYVEKEIIIKK